MTEKQKTKAVQLLLNAAKTDETYFIESNNTYIYFTGYYGIISKTPIQNLQGLKDYKDYSVKHGCHDLVFKQLQSMKENCIDELLKEPLSPEYIKTEIAIRKMDYSEQWGLKSSSVRCYNFGMDKPMVNIEYLYRMTQLMPEAIILYDSEQLSLSPLWFKGLEFRGFMLPVRKTEGYKTQMNTNENDDLEQF